MYRSQIIRYAVLCCVLLLIPFGTAYAHRDPGLPDSEIAGKIDTLIHSDGLKYGFVGILVESLKDNRVIYSHSSDHIYMPASNMKIVVSAAILDKLGPDYRFKTELLTTGEKYPEGKLAGDLYLKGYGDATMETPDLAELADQIKSAGITRITGNVIVDDTWFDDQRLGWGWSWDDEPYYYSAQISALVLNRNTVAVWVRPGKSAGLPAVVTLNPPTGYMEIENNATTGPTGSNSSLNIGRKRGRNIITVSGMISVDAKPSVEYITMEEPALYVGNVFLNMLKQRGITVVGKVRRARTPSVAKVLYTRYSEPLSKVLTLLNKPSDNLIAECLLKALGAEAKGQGTVARGEEAELEFIRKIGGDPEQINIVDGSGLSRMDMISPRNLVTILRYMHISEHAQVFMDSLPVAGVDGTLRNRMKGSLAEKSVKAKTGYVGRVCTLSGYLTTKGGEPLVFALMMNHYTCPTKDVRGIQDEICKILAEMP